MLLSWKLINQTILYQTFMIPNLNLYCSYVVLNFWPNLSLVLIKLFLYKKACVHHHVAMSHISNWFCKELVMALRTELPVICVTSILRSCLSSSHFACPASSLKLTNWRICRAGFESGSCFFRAWFVPFSSLVCAIFDPGSCLARAWFVPFSSLVRSIFEPGSFHCRAWFVPFSSLVCAIFDPAFYSFRARLVPFSSIVHASLRCSRLISFAKEITTEFMISYYVFVFLSTASVLTWRNVLRSVL